MRVERSVWIQEVRRELAGLTAWGQNREASEQTHSATVGNTEWVGVQAKHDL